MITAGHRTISDQNCHMSLQIEFDWTKCPPIEPLLLVVPGRGLCQPLVLPRNPTKFGEQLTTDHCLSACGELG
jgi:hypothetical protein